MDNSEKELERLKEIGEAPDFLRVEGYKILQGGYLLAGETPRQMYSRVSKAAGSYYADSDKWTKKFFEVMWKNWLCPASPVLSNMGTDRGLPISCNSIHVGDSVDSIFKKAHELAMLSKNSAGVGIYMGDVRGRGSSIRGNGKSEGLIPWAKVYDSTIVSVSQGNFRRGAGAVYTDIRHVDIEEFIQMRRPTGDVNRRCMNLNHGICIDDLWMQEMIQGDLKKRHLWQEILKARVETGEPYLFFTDNVNRQNPQCYVDNNLKVRTSNICTEIFLHTDPDHSFVCCLSSMNLVKWDEWKDTDAVETSVRFLDAVLEEYIKKSEKVPGLEASRRSAMKGRAIGIGVLGWHTLLQKNMIPFDSFDAMMMNAQIFKTLKDKAESETKVLAAELGEPEWCKGYGRRNSHLLAVAPTVSNSTISGGHSAGIEPIPGNVYSQKSAKGTFIRKNTILESYLETIGKNTPEIWKSINEQSGSVQHLKFLGENEKAVFLTAREINQYAIIKQAAQRQKFIDQGQSVNLFFGANADPKYIHGVHLEAWQSGLKSLYYFRTEGVIRGDLASRSKDECAACEA
ncbi:MAG: ribonucleoside-diphosphate reductase subunit alpha [Leptolyngbyaceae cyanobacterium RM2_2_4]|nr:ribonucleoside-diphosphate reductase subunit alpha [Leptolyngbyaceae cyanobacterium RM2_2_4]